MAVAHRMYARALFQTAQDEGRLDEVAADLAALAGALEDVPELRAFLRNPQIDPLEKARVAVRSPPAPTSSCATFSASSPRRAERASSWR